MSEILLDTMDSVWTVSDPSLVTISVDTFQKKEGIGSNYLNISAGSNGVIIDKTLSDSVDLSEMDEVRFWIRGTKKGFGDTALIKFGFGKVDPTENEFLVDLYSVNWWEHRRFYLGDILDSTINGITKLRFTILTSERVRLWIDEIIGVKHEFLKDVNRELLSVLGDIYYDNYSSGNKERILVPVHIAPPEEEFKEEIYPAISIFMLDMSSNLERDDVDNILENFSTSDVEVRNFPEAFDLNYEFQIYSLYQANLDDILGQVLTRLPAFSYIRFGGETYNVEMVNFRNADILGEKRILRKILGYSIETEMISPVPVTKKLAKTAIIEISEVSGPPWTNFP